MVYKARYDYFDDKEELKAAIREHKRKGSIFEEETLESPKVILNLNRAENELKHAETIFKISGSKKLKLELDLLEEDTFYSGAISHAYYAIFFAAKALLLSVKIRTKIPNVHKATLDAFSYYFVINGKLDLELLKIYRSAIVRADSLLGLYVSEKEKRGRFTYQKLPDANREPADSSIRNAITFLTHIKKLIVK